MGKSSNPQPAHTPVHADSVIPKPLPLPLSPRSSCSASGASTPATAAGKLACSHALDATRPPSPSPLTLSLSSKPPPTCYDADPTSFSSSPFLSLTSDTIVDGDEVFYDALDEFLPQPHQPVRTSVQQTFPNPEFDGAPKGRTGVAPGRNSARHAVYTPMPPTNFTSTGPGRGSSRPTASPAAAQSSGIAQSLQASLAQWTFVRQPVRKALLVGINYAHLGEGKRLYYAAQDASRFESSLKKSGFLPQNIMCLSEGSRSEPPTLDYLKKHMAWLVRGAQKGDTLFFMFSGHCVKDLGILTLDGQFISQEQLYKELVQPVPAGCELQIVFDCCSAASMVPLQYCVGHMAPPPAPESAEPVQPECDPQADPRSSELGSSAQPRSDPLIGSLDGLAAVAPAPVSPDITPIMADVPSFAPPTSHRQRGGVVAAPPVEQAAAPAGTVTERATGFVASWLGLGQAATEPSATPTRGPGSVAAAPVRAPAAGHPWRGRHVVVEGARIPDYFAERKEGFIKPAGNVMVWAGTGEAQQAFEAYGNVNHGVVTNAICGALEACIDSSLTRRDLWRFLVGAIDAENVHRGKRDAKKGESDRQDPRLRVQHAELWVSQAQPLESSASVLDQMVFPAPS